MKGTKLILATIVVIGATVNFGVQGFPKPQGIPENEERTIVDGFAFDGPADRTRPSRLPPTGPPTPSVPPTLPTRPTTLPTRPPVVGPTNPTQSPVVAPTNPTQPPVVAPTPVPSTVSPEVARCAQNCQVTPEYNPVCGSDGNMYSNNGLLNCVRNCGANITLSHIGRCSSNGRG